MKKQRGGTSLIETLVTLWMIGVMLLLVAELAKNIRQESVYNKDHDQRMGAHQALERIGQALRSSKEILEPSLSGSSHRLRLQSWDPSSNAGRLPNPPATTGSWTADDPLYLNERRFEVGSDGVLLCTTLAGSTESIRLLGDLESFTVTGQGDGTYRLELKWVDSKGKPRDLVRYSAVMPI
ncbi:MAG: type II secretion system protein [Candidatus Eremiobacteraeota bacterium]|nr:type II secretion system protein [Candidatus Eremiobacteraeota bacterium]MCW5870312.1 type II secretion system protein [Candidatus Eremiobacteraeota bacterium]